MRAIKKRRKCESGRQFAINPRLGVKMKVARFWARFAAVFARLPALIFAVTPTCSYASLFLGGPAIFGPAARAQIKRWIGTEY